nr:MAG TPA: hypothetical protein [Bacteriophage sp.]
MRRFKYPRHMQFCIQKSVKNFSQNSTSILFRFALKN